MRSALDVETSRALLNEAESARASLDQKVAGEAATALALLIRDGLEGLERALDPATQVELGAATKHWLAFRRATASTIATIASEHGSVGLAFFLGWLKRLAVLSEPAASRHPSQAASRRAAGLAAPQLKAGDTVEAILLEERTKRGGWKARHTATGLEGPIVNSDDLPADSTAGDALTLVVASASRREVSFRYRSVG